MENSPVGESQSNGFIENAIRDGQRQIFKIDFASRFPPRHLEASRLRGFEVMIFFSVEMDWGSLRGTFGTTFGI